MAVAGLTAVGLMLLGGSASAVTYSPSSLTFGNTKLGATSPPQSVTVRGGMCGPDLFDPITMTIKPGPCAGEPTDVAVSGQFAIAGNTCPNPLVAIDINNKPPCTISVAFKPTSLGPQQGFLRLTSSPSIVGVPLSGTGCKKVKTKSDKKKLRCKPKKKKT
jgi:hypothetical protein